MAEVVYLRHADVLRETGVTPRQLTHWAETGVIVPSVLRPDGSGTRRGYSPADVQRVRILKELASLRMPVLVMRRIADALQANGTMRLGLVTITKDGE